MQFITTDEGARQVGITPMAFNRWLRKGYMPSARQLPNGYWIVTQEALNQLLADRAVGKIPKRGPHPKVKKQIFETFVGTKRM